MYLNSLYSFSSYLRAFLIIKSFNLPKKLIDRYHYYFYFSKHREIEQQAQKSHSSKVKQVGIEPRLAQQAWVSKPISATGGGGDCGSLVSGEVTAPTGVCLSTSAAVLRLWVTAIFCSARPSSSPPHTPHTQPHPRST